MNFVYQHRIFFYFSCVYATYKYIIYYYQIQLGLRSLFKTVFIFLAMFTVKKKKREGEGAHIYVKMGM